LVSSIDKAWAKSKFTINADGKLDILTANNGSDNVTALLGK